MGARRLPHGLTIIVAVLLAMVTAPAAAHADDIRDDQWHLRTLQVERAHQISQGEGVTVALLDTGVQHDHPDLKGNVLPGWDAVTGGSGDGWGDHDGHGTGMAGLIAAHGHGPGGREGALGIAPKAKILPIRIESKLGPSDGEPIGNAIEYARTRGVKIVSMSFGGGGVSEKQEGQILDALEADMILIFAIGNRSKGSTARYPATEPGVLAVGAVDRKDGHGGISVVSKAVRLVAPGERIVSTDSIRKPSDTGYRIGTGSSPSTAIVAGAAALVWSKYPDLTGAEVIQRLTYTAHDLGPAGRDDHYGFGRLDLVRALTEPDVPPPDPWPYPMPSPGTATAPPADTSTTGPLAAPPGPEFSARAYWPFYLGLALCLALVAAAVALIAYRLLRRRRPR